MNVTPNIPECASDLRSCHICGATPRLEYSFDLDSVRIPGKKHPHCFRVCCESICDNAGTDKIYAEDDEADVAEALRMLVLLWNSLPDKPDDAAIHEMYRRKLYYFKDEEEAKLYYQQINQPFHEESKHVAVLV